MFRFRSLVRLSACRRFSQQYQNKKNYLLPTLQKSIKARYNNNESCNFPGVRFYHSSFTTFLPRKMTNYNRWDEKEQHPTTVDNETMEELKGLHNHKKTLESYDLDEGVEELFEEGELEALLAEIDDDDDDMQNTLNNSEMIYEEEVVYSPVFDKEQSQIILDRAYKVVEENRCKATVVVDVTGKHERCHFFIMGTTFSTQHAKSVAVQVRKLMSEFKLKKSDCRVEGEGDGSGWVVIEIGGVQIHLMDSLSRQNLELEKLWTLGKFDDQMHTFLSDPVEKVQSGKRLRPKYN